MQKIIDKIENGERLNADEALDLLENAETLTLAELANKKRYTLHPEPVVTYVVDRNINYTNICRSGCLFCAFYRTPDSPEGYVLSKEELAAKIKETQDLGGTQILLQGGIHPELPLSYYEELLQFIRKNFSIHVHGFSPPEIAFLAQKSSLDIEKVLERLIASGLGSIPGGGAEILDDRVRKRISPKKCDSATWLEVMRVAHKSGLKTTATMMFGHVETPEQMLGHVLKIRELQDETGGFTAFIPWTFQPENTGIKVKKASSVSYLRVLALCRLVLDNVPNLQASWVTQGDKIAQMALVFGANDLGSTMLEENVVAAAGVKFRLPQEEMVRLITDAGFAARQRDCFYNILS
jgi:cyclic dehypoxanthinyl futalosine synthase